MSIVKTGAAIMLVVFSWTASAEVILGLGSQLRYRERLSGGGFEQSAPMSYAVGYESKPWNFQIEYLSIGNTESLSLIAVENRYQSFTLWSGYLVEGPGLLDLLVEAGMGFSREETITSFFAAETSEQSNWRFNYGLGLGVSTEIFESVMLKTTGRWLNPSLGSAGALTANYELAVNMQLFFVL